MDQNIMEKVFDELKGIMGPRATRSLMHRKAYSRDWSPRERKAADFLDIVVIPKTTEEMVQIAQIAYKDEISIVPFGGGTGMGGGVAAWKGGILVKTKGMNRVFEIDEKNFTVTVQAGITIWELNEVLAQR